MIAAVVFDLGGVLLDWNPRHLYRKLIPEPAAMERFLAEVCTHAWHERQDAGGSCAAAVAELSAAFPEQAELIAAFYARFGEMISGPIAGTVEIAAHLRRAGVPLYALSNWPAEIFHHAWAFEFMRWFEGVVVSGVEGVMKPDRRIFDILLRRYALDPAATLFIDDVAANVAAAAGLGLQVHRFRNPAMLAAELRAHGLIGAAAADRIAP